MNMMFYHINDLLYLIFVQMKLILPYWLGGIVLGGILSSYWSDKIALYMKKLQSSRHPHLVLLLASVIGAISPITMYGMVPIVLIMFKKGMPQEILASFIVTSVLINPNVFFYSFALGADIAFLRLAVTILAGYLGGILTKALIKQNNLFHFNDDQTANTSNNRKTRPAIKTMLKTIRKTLPYLLLGIFLTALFEKYIPKNVFDNIFADNLGLSSLFASALGVPLYFCGGGSIALIKAWMDSGMSTGSVMAFIVAGPATKINNIGAIAAMTNKKYVILYLCYIFVFSTVTGTIIDLVL